jgi:PAS domain S-box-containing protein
MTKSELPHTTDVHEPVESPVQNPATDIVAGAGHASSADGFFALVDHNPFGVYVIDADFRMARVSPSAQEVFSNVRPLLRRDFAEVLRIVWPEPFATHAIERFRHTLDTGEGYVSSSANTRGDINVVEEYDWRIERLTLPDGRPGVVCFYYDLSARSRWEHALRESEARLRLATEAAGVGIWSWQSSSDTVFWENSRPYEILGMPTDAPPVTAARFEAEIVLPAHRAKFADALARAVRDDTPFHFEGQIRRIDGEIRWIEFTGKRVAGVDGSTGRLVGTMRDINAQKEAEIHLREIEERSAFVRLSSGVGFWYCDLPFDVLQWDNLVKAHFHLPTDAVVTIQTFYERLHAEDREPTRAAIERSIAEHTPYCVDYRTVHPETGAIMHVRAVGRTFYADDGTPIRFDGVTFDVSEQKLAEASLRDADRRKDEFLATLSHELRNPLAPIRNGLEMLRLAGTVESTERVRSMMERQLSQLVRLVDDLLDISRVTSDKLELRRATVTMRSVIDTAVETSGPIIDAAGHEVIIAIPDEPILVHVDVTRMAQIVSNLLNNSARYMRRGGRIWLTVRRSEDMAVVSVADEGIGIPTDMLCRVFEMFTQVERALEKTTGGLGIGLSLVKRLVELHGGTVEARSDGDGQGSEFLVRIPVLEVHHQSPARLNTDQEPGALTRHRILVVDDNADAAEALRQLLEFSGQEVTTANDGARAVDMAETFAPDVILLDIGMPNINGYDTARRILSGSSGKAPVLVALTGLGHEENRAQSKAAGFDHHLLKPVKIAELTKLLAALPMKSG